MKIDIFNHIFPKAYFDRMIEVAPNGADMHKRVRNVPSIVDLDERFRIMDKFGDYIQIICLPQMPVEVFGPPPVSTDLARLGNDGMAQLVKKYPDRFLGFVAALPMNDPGGTPVRSHTRRQRPRGCWSPGLQQCSGPSPDKAGNHAALRPHV